MKRTVPKFRNPEEAALFWESHDILDSIKPDEFKVVDPKKTRCYRFVNPKRRARKELISLRIDSWLLDLAKKIAARSQVGYQVLLRKWLEKGAPAH